MLDKHLIAKYTVSMNNGVRTGGLPSEFECRRLFLFFGGAIIGTRRKYQNTGGLRDSGDYLA